MSQRAEYLKRQAFGRRAWPDVQRFLIEALGGQLDQARVLDLEESDHWYEVFEQAWRQAQSGKVENAHIYSIEGNSREEVLRRVAQVGETLQPDLEVALFLPQWSYCGAICMPASVAIGAAGRLIRVDQEDLLACDRTGRTGITLEAFSYRGATQYKFLAWTPERHSSTAL